MESTGLARFLFELASEERLGILAAISEKPLRHAQIARRVRMTDSETTRHLNRLTAAGLVTKRSEEHTSELQSRLHLVCRLLLEKKKKKNKKPNIINDNTHQPIIQENTTEHTVT